MRSTQQPIRLLSLFVLALLVFLTGIPAALAQSVPAIPLSENQPVADTIDADSSANVYIFVGVAGDIININTTSPEPLPLSLLLTDAQGAIVAQTASQTGAASLTNIILDRTGTYFVSVVGAPGAVGAYELVKFTGEVALPETPETPEATETVEDLEPTEAVIQLPETTPTVEAPPLDVTVAVPDATPEATQEAVVTLPEVETTPAEVVTWTEPQQIQLVNGIEVRLQWSAEVDMNLEVRDPLGNSLFWNSPQTPIGGNFGFDANGLCEIISENPVETATWRPGFLPTGSYEILVFYRQSCVEPAAPVPFTITVTVNGEVLPSIEGALNPPPPNQDSVYIANFVVNDDGTGRVNTGGVYPDSSLNILPASAADLAAQALPIQRDVAVTGAVFEQQDYVAYAYAAQEGEIISLDLNATSGSLDTLLQVVGPSGNLIQVNDDEDLVTTDSSIDSLTLGEAGQYLIVVTRYGKELGGTEGEFELILTGSAATVPDAVTNLNLPQGDIAISLTWATNADLQLLVRDPLGDAVFDDAQQINSGGQLVEDGNVNCTQAEGTPVSYIYWPFGFLRAGIYEVEVWYQNNCNDLTPVEFTLTIQVDGEVVAVERQQPAQGQRYVIAFTVNPDRSVDVGLGGYIGANSTALDYVGDLPNAQPMTIGSTVSGTITLDNAYDLYTFEGTAGQVVSISMQATSPPLDTKLFLIGPNGVEVADNDDIDPLLITDQARTDALINAFVLPQDGTYTIIATRFGTIYGGTIGGYQLSIEG